MRLTNIARDTQTRINAKWIYDFLNDNDGSGWQCFKIENGTLKIDETGMQEVKEKMFYYYSDVPKDELLKRHLSQVCQSYQILVDIFGFTIDEINQIIRPSAKGEFKINEYRLSQFDKIAV